MSKYVNIVPHIERKMTDKERALVDSVIERASARKHKKKYTPKYIVDFMLESFKDFSYDAQVDAIDMLDSILEIASKTGVLNQLQIKETRQYIMNEYVNSGRFAGDEE